MSPLNSLGLYLAAALFSFSVSAQTWKPVELHKTDEVIWSLEQISTDEILFSTRNGSFQLLNLKTKKAQKIQADLQVQSQGQGGLLDLSPHPDFKNNNKIYFTYSCKKGLKNTTCLAAGVLDKDKSTLSSIKELFAAEPYIDSNLHFGSRLAWDENKNLYMTMGDRYKEKDQAQDLKSHLGKVFRLDENGKAAAQNPFASQPTAKPEIFSYGHRNPQGLFYDFKSKTLWQTEHGARGGDEVNKIEAGENFGWPVITHGVDYSGAKIGEGKAKAGMEQPFYYYVPSIATSSLIVYSGKKYKDLQNHFFIGALAGQHINHLEIKDGKVFKENKISTNDRVRDLIEIDTGDIIYSTDSGRILKLVRN